MASEDLDELVNNHHNKELTSTFYPTSNFTSGFDDSNDAFDNHNPFADLKPTDEFKLPTSTSSPIASSSASPFARIDQEDDSKPYSSTQGSHFDQGDGIPSYQQTASFTSFDTSGIGNTRLITQEIEDEGGFDGKGLTMPDTLFNSFEPSDNGFADDDPGQPITAEFMPDDPAFQDQESLEPPSHQVQEIVSPASPVSRPSSHLFGETNVLQSSSQNSPPPSGTSTPSAPLSRPAPFRPFGVTATLTSSSVDEDIDEPLMMNNSSLRSISSSRPALPDILGGGSSAASMLLPDTRGALPAFKKSPKKPIRPTGSSETLTPSRSPSSNHNDTVKRQISSDVPKPYRPLGLKIAEAKPIIAIVASEDPVPNPAPTTPSQLPAPKLAQPILTTSSSDQIPYVTPPARQMTPPVTVSHDQVDSVPEATKVEKENFAQVESESVPTSSLPIPEEPADPPLPASVEPPSASSQDKELNQDSNSKSSTRKGVSLSISAPAPPSSLPSLNQSPTDVARVENSIKDTQKLQDDPRADESIDPVPPVATVPTSDRPSHDVVNIPQSEPRTQEVKPQSDTDSEDERPLASVREGLVQQQSSGQNSNLIRKDPATGLTPTTPAQVYFGSQDPLRDLPIQPPGPRYKCSVGDPQKMGMINDIHTVYTVKTLATDPSASGPLNNSSTVLRRFRDFVWLFDALTSNNPGVIVPPIPDKNLRSRFQEGFIATRRVALEIFLQKTANHPMLVSDPDLKLFLESDSFSLEIKHRKPDPSHQTGWLANIAGPRFHETDDFFEQRKGSLDTLEAQLKGLHSSLSAAAKARRAYASSLSELSQALLTLSTCDLSKPIRNALDRLAGVHRQCHVWSEEQSKQELEGLTATVEAYTRLINSVRLTFASRVKSWEKWQASLNNLKKVQSNHEKAKRYSTNEHSSGLMYSLNELLEAERRAQDARNEFGDVSKLIKAEMQRFDTEKVEDFKSAICDYVDGFTERQRKIVHIWQDYYQLLQSLAKQNAESSTAQSAKPVQNPDSQVTTADPSAPSSGTTDDIQPSPQTGSTSNGHPSNPAPPVEQTIESPWANESSQPDPQSVSPTDNTPDLPPSILADSSAFDDVTPNHGSPTHDYPTIPGFES